MEFMIPRVVPVHYQIDPDVPTSLSDEVDWQPFPFMRLPVELRLRVYKDYMVDRYSPSPAEINEVVLDPLHRTGPPSEILQVSKAVNAEVCDLLRHESTFNFGICWQGATFDGLAILCFQPRGKRFDYDDIPHLRVECILYS